MNLKEQNYEIQLDIEEIKPFEERILFSGMCDFIIPMKFSNMGDKKIIKYNCCNYMAVGDMELSDGRTVLEILEKTLVTLSKSIEFYILPENVTLNIDTVFYNPRKKQVKIAYVPFKGNNLLQNIKSYMYQLYEESGDEAKEYLENIMEYVDKYNLDIRHMASFVHEQRRIMYQCIESKGASE